jgi:uncharacterized protein with HEPN domain
MPRDLRAYLWDIEQAAGNIEIFTQGKQLSDYQRDAMLRAAVERCFERMGEALVQVQRLFPEVGSRIANTKQIIAFRNRLIHGYATVRDELVWEIVQTDLATLRQQAADLLHEIECRNSDGLQ